MRVQQATPRQRRPSLEAVAHGPIAHFASNAQGVGVSGRIATPMVSNGSVGGGGMSGRVPTPMVPVSSGQMGVGGWEHRQRTPMFRTSSTSSVGGLPVSQRLGSGLASAHGRSRLDIVGEGGSEQASPATTPPDMAIRPRHALVQGDDRNLPLWLRGEGNGLGGREESSSLAKPLWLQNDDGSRSQGGGHSWGSDDSDSYRGAFPGQHSLQPAIASYMAPQRLYSQSQGRRGGMLDRPPTGQGRADGLQC